MYDLIAFYSDIEMDATEMEFVDGEFDLVIDKGTLDSVLV